MKIKKLKKRKTIPTKEIKEEPEVEDKTLFLKQIQSEYEDMTKKTAYTEDGSPTKDFMEWSEQRERFDYLSLKSDRKSKKVRKEQRILKIGYKISQLWSAQTISMAIKNEGGYEIHGWMKNNFDDYDDLINGLVLDRAMYYSKRYYTPEAIKTIQGFKSLDDFEITFLKYKKEIDFKSYPGLKYWQEILLTRNKFEDSFTWIRNYDYEIDEFETKVTYAPANTGLLGFCDYNLPVSLVLHAPGKNEAIFDVRMEADELNNLKEDINYKIIHQLQNTLETKDIEVDKERRGKLQLRRELDVWKQEILERAPVDIRARYQDIQRKAYGTSKYSWQNIVIVILCVVVVIALYGAFTGFN
ncbi:MAG: hypothetical protein ACFFAS_18585 [Promethearchaeota archaeon]